MEDSFSMGCGGWIGSGSNMSNGSGGNVSDGERWGAADEVLLTCPLLTFCCAARFLTGRGPVSVRSPGVGDPCYRGSF